MKDTLFLSIFYCFAFFCSTVHSMHECTALSKEKKVQVTQLLTDYGALPAQKIVMLALDIKEHKHDLGTCIKLLEYAAWRNNVQALYELGLIYKTGDVQQKDLEKALGYFYDAAKRHHRPSCYEVGLLLCSKQEYAQGAYWLLRAAHAEQVNSRLLWYMPALCFIEEVHAGIHDIKLYQALINLCCVGDYYMQRFDKACTAYTEKKYTDAYEGFSYLAQYKHPLALYMLGVCYDTGNGVERDIHKAYSSYKQAANYGYIPAQQACVMREQLIKENAQEPTQEPTRIEQYIKCLSNYTDTNTDALQELLEACITDGTLKDNEQFARILDQKNMCCFLERHAKTVNNAAYLCGLIYQDKDAEKADTYFKLAAQNDSLRAGFVLGQRYTTKFPIQALNYYLTCALSKSNAGHTLYEQELVRKALAVLEESAEKQDSYAQICLVLYGMGMVSKEPQLYQSVLHLCEKIFSQASNNISIAKLIQISALPSMLEIYARTDSHVEYLQALLYLNVLEFIDTARGMSCLQAAAGKGVPEAQVMLSICLVNGTNIKQDLQQAFSLLMAAHNQGFYLATFHLAFAYEEGILVPQDLEKSRALYNSSCLDTYAPALCCRLINMLKHPPDNQVEAYKLFDLVEPYAQAGDRDACLCLGNLYYHFKDSWGKDRLVRAFNYLESAALQGYPAAYRIMGRMLYFAEGIMGDKAHGEELICKAITFGDEEAKCDLADVFYNQKKYKQAFEYYYNYFQKSKKSKDITGAVAYSADATAGLALCYVYGHGVKRDIRQAVNYMCMALKQGVSVTTGYKSHYVKRVLPLMVTVVLELVERNDTAAQHMLELLKRTMHSVGLAWRETSDTVIIYRTLSNEAESKT